MCKGNFSFPLHIFVVREYSGELVSGVTTRPFEAPDLRALYAIEEVCFAPPLRFSRALMRELSEDPDCRTWMGIVDGVRAGFAIVGLKGEGGGNHAYIWTIEVLPAFRRMGIARQLLLSVEESARAADCATLELHVAEKNREAQALYESAGFARCGVDLEYYGHGQDGLRYRKVLQDA